MRPTRTSATLLIITAATAMTYTPTNGQAQPRPAHYIATVAALPASWPCGEGTCLNARIWKPLTPQQANVLYQGERTTPSTAWESCWTSHGKTIHIACPDGTVETP